MQQLSVFDRYNGFCDAAPMDLSERLKAARSYAELTQVQLAERSGTSQQVISAIERGKAETSGVLPQLAAACGVSALWLATEEGPMLAKAQDEPAVIREALSDIQTTVVFLAQALAASIQPAASDMAVALRRLPAHQREKPYFRVLEAALRGEAPRPALDSSRRPKSRK
jgi:transcriptional regulator with XRE-family HTH domain